MTGNPGIVLVIDDERNIRETLAELVESEGVLLLPGWRLGQAGNRVRLGFGRLDLPEALAGLERFVSR